MPEKPVIKRYFEPGLAYFVTSVTYKRKPIFTIAKVNDIFLLTVEYLKLALDYKIFAYCVMPDHIHIIIQPCGEYDLSYIMKMIKGGFARRYNKLNVSGGAVWQRKFYEETIRNEAMLFSKIEYIHNNPLKANLASCLENFSYSSYQNFFTSERQILNIDNLWD